MSTTYLARTPSSASNRKTWTWSGWFKRASKTDSNNGRIFAAGTGSSDYTSWYMYAVNGTDGTLQFQNRISGTTTSVALNRKFRDVNAWYHLVIAVDTTQANASDRMKIYVNGSQETSFSTFNPPAQNVDTMVNNNNSHTIGSSDTTGYTPRYWAGSMSHIHFIDGTAYNASAFGSTDSVTGEWSINTSPSVSYGTNGFWILKDGNSVTDSSPNSNNYTVAGGTLTKTEDCPSNVFATLNPLVKPNDYTLSQGNNTIAYGSASTRACCLSTLGMSSGKFYAELKITATSTTPCQGSVGIANDSDNTNSGYYPSQGNTDNAASYQFWDGSKNIGSSGAAYGNTVAANDIMGFAFDIDNKAMYVSKNGVWQNSGDPTSGASKTNAIDFSPITDNGFWFLIVGDGSGAQTFTSSFNFGNGYFGTTAVSSAGTNASGNGIFEYDTPTGYTALSTKGLNL